MKNYIYLTLKGNIPFIFLVGLFLSCVCMFYKQVIQFNNNSLFKRNIKYLIDETKFIFLTMYGLQTSKALTLLMQLVFTAS